jgi:pyridoxal phosphate enzyme (YggS family)
MSLKENLLSIQDRINSAIYRSGDTRAVEVVAVTKTHPFKTIEESFQCGILSIGENRVQEAIQKFKSFKDMPELTRRFIGHLQTNKVNKCLSLFDTVDSIDSLRLAKKIDNQSKKLNRKTTTLLEVNTSGEAQKQGFSPINIEDMVSAINLKNIVVEGIMTIGPNTKNKQKTRKAFVTLRKLKETINAELGVERLTHLSMGMSGDFEVGIEEGSTMVRLGTALFGARKTKNKT